MNRALFLFLQWTWGILQNAAGAFLLLLVWMSARADRLAPIPE